MGDSEASELGKRLERVERDMRRYRVALAVLGLAVLAAGGLNAVRPASASGTPAVIQARKFQVVDGAGRVRAELAMVGDWPMLRLYDKAEKVRAALGNADVKDARTGSTEHRASSSLVLLNEKENVLWEAP